MTPAPPALALFVFLLGGVLLVLPGSAVAASGTYTPPMLRGDLDIGYQGALAVIQLEDRSNDDDAWTEVASSLQQRHIMMISGSFAPYHGVSISLDLPILFHDQLSWNNANDFHYDPVSHRSTMAGGSALDALTLEGSPASLRRFGFGDIALHFRVVPFAQAGLPHRQAPISMAFDIALRFPSGQNQLQTRDDGSGYPGKGGMGITVGTTAARSFGAVEPHISIHYTHNGPYEIDGQDSTTEEVGEQAAGDSFRLRTGGDITAFYDSSNGRSVHLDLSVEASYHGPKRTLSGLRLPTALIETRGQPAVVSEHVEVGANLGLAFRPRPQVEIHMDFGTDWISPHSLERVTANAYSVRTRNGSLSLHWAAGVRIHFL